MRAFLTKFVGYLHTKDPVNEQHRERGDRGTPNWCWGNQILIVLCDERCDSPTGKTSCRDYLLMVLRKREGGDGSPPLEKILCTRSIKDLCFPFFPIKTERSKKAWSPKAFHVVSGEGTGNQTVRVLHFALLVLDVLCG